MAMTEAYLKLVPPVVEGKGFFKILKDAFVDTPKIEVACKDLSQRIYQVSSGRALFVTRRGFMGLAPWNALVGDKVCVLLGGFTSFLLRSE